MATPEQQLEELKATVGILTTNLMSVSSRLDAVTTQGTTTASAVEALRAEAREAISGGTDAKGKGKRLMLVSPKDLKPIMFGRKEDLPVRHWGKKTNNMLNITCPTIRAAMTFAETLDK